MDDNDSIGEESPIFEIKGPHFSSNILDLPNEILLEILSFCDVPSLLRLCCVCRCFKQLISEDCVWLPHLRHLTIVKNIHCIYKPNKISQSQGLKVKVYNNEDNLTNSVDITPTSMKMRHMSVKLKEYFKLSFNWCGPQYSERIAVRHKTKQMPWLAYDGNHIWLSTQNKISCFKPGKKISEITSRSLQVKHSNTDISHFVMKDFLTVCGCRNGSVYVWNNETAQIYSHGMIHAGETQCVDFNQDVILSGSRDCTVKVLPLSEIGTDLVKSTFNMQERIWSLSLCPSGDKCAIGTAGITSDCPLTIWNLNKHCMMYNLNENVKKVLGAGVLDIKFESPDILLTCGYDTYLRMWDLRTGKCVSKWEEPFDSTLVTLQTDYNHSLLTGSSQNALSILWDKRAFKPVQLYHAKRGNRRSPVYSLAFDSQSMYVALDLTLNIMNFNC